MAAEVPAIGPLLSGGATLHHDGVSFSVSPRRGRPTAGPGRRRGARMDRPLPGAHPRRRARRGFQARPRWTCSPSRASRATGCWRMTHPAGRAVPWARLAERAIERSPAALAAPAPRASPAPAWRLPSGQHPVDAGGRAGRSRAGAALRRPGRRAAWGRRCRTCGCCCRATGASAPVSSAAAGRREQFRPSTGASWR